ncbi:uncharacterized protein BX663DRAFT_531268 [Cokeromyces recurvatus]|uniref:uncharacterized protein n=1 Tax=Cokeromyces recurvatus TaxID=90255 RepID=UPI00221E3B07|nr:uncharacterized protein BX663DRAFT_531268 [Cokeromyces recurvatus]KAI7902749.1 hypothetical protein BX663DRAFT_531268 [Cokeromyces recurvatus]
MRKNRHTFTIIIISLILIPTIPLLLYAIGLLLPSSHTISRSAKYNTTAEILWAILTSVEDYPAWRSNIDRVTVRRDEFEDELNKYDDSHRLTFVEYTKKDRRTVVMHIEQTYAKKLLRVLEERPYIAPGEQVPQKNSTFTGSWTFTLEPVEGERAVILKITEQGVIKKPMVRVSHRLFFGYHRRIDRFLKDLTKEVDLGILDKLEEEERKNQEVETIQEEDEYEERPDESMIQSSVTAPLLNDHMTESKLLDKEWEIIKD